MYNEIKSPVNGRIKDILVHKNQSVKSGEIIMLLE
jgi:biotin carboxyl carrier protein